MKFWRILRKLSLWFLAVLATIIIIVSLTIFGFLGSSLPKTTGKMTTDGLLDTVTVARDEKGVVTIEASNRQDVAFALGLCHAQDRFFQMDLSRRRAAGELSELLGRGLVEFDKTNRIHRFRHRASLAVDLLSSSERGLLIAYTNGVNKGLGELTARPFEYLLLRQNPRPWEPEDTLLVIYSMYLQLQDSSGRADLVKGAVRSVMSEEAAQFFLSNGTSWDSSMDGDTFPILDLPGEQAFKYLNAAGYRTGPTVEIGNPWQFERNLGGSNNWAINGSKTSGDRAILACDMHLGLMVPNVWYRAVFAYLNEKGEKISVSGVTLPGFPLIVIGSNDNLAWGFTNSRVDTCDVVVLKHPDGKDSEYLTAEGSLPFLETRETINVKGAEPVEITVRETVFGPVTSRDKFGQDIATLWVAHQPEAVNLSIVGLEQAKTVEDLEVLVQSIRMPALNLVAADSQEHIFWSIMGSLFGERDYDYSVPQPSDHIRGSFGTIEPMPWEMAIQDPDNEMVWTANNRVRGGDWYRIYGNGGLVNSARGQKIRNTLSQMDSASETDMLALQLNHQSDFMKRWQELVVRILDDSELTDPRVREMRSTVKDWNGYADKDSVAYRLIRRFREIVFDRLLSRVFQPVIDSSGGLSLRDIDIWVDLEESFYLIVNQRPRYLLDEGIDTWTEEMDSMIEQLLAELGETKVEAFTWGSRNRLQMRHPLSRFLGPLGKWLDMPQHEMSGDFYVPHVTSPGFSASQRMVVSPGREKDGFFHMPGGQSGHPLSPYYRKGHEDWVNGSPAPFLPEKVRKVLLLKPAKSSNK